MAPDTTRGVGAPLWRLGILVSLVALAGVVWWAAHQQAPPLPDEPDEIAAMLGAIACYGVATLVRAERWHWLLLDEKATPRRADTYALTCVGYMGNNVLPARAGDAIRVVLMAPRAQTSKRTVVGTLLAERILDVGLLVVAFVVVGYGLLGEIGARDLEIVLAVALAGVLVAAGVLLVVRRNERVRDWIAPIASSTLGLRRAHHGARLLAITVVIWAVETCVWLCTGAAVGFPMDPLEGVYLVALASVFAMIPSGPAYAGTQDAAVAIGVRALGGTGATAVAYIVMLRFVVVVPITVLGFVLLAARYGGLSRLRTARLEAQR